MTSSTQTQVAPLFLALEPFLTRPRLAPYLALMQGDQRKAVALYQWNVSLSGAMHEALHVFEVVLRNAMDSRLCVWNATQVDKVTGANHSHDWLLDPSHLLQRLVPLADRAKAKSRAGNSVPRSRRITHADVLAQMPFSAWRFLLPDKDPGRKLLWRDSLSAAFPGLARSEDDLVRAVSGIYGIRNRVAHMEPLLRTTGVKDQFDNMRQILKEIDPAVETWFISNQRVTSELKRQPQP